MDFESLLAQRREGLNTEQTRKMEEAAARQRQREAAAIEKFDATARRILQGVYAQAEDWRYTVTGDGTLLLVTGVCTIAGESWTFRTPKTIGAIGLHVSTPSDNPNTPGNSYDTANVDTLNDFLDLGVRWSAARSAVLEKQSAHAAHMAEVAAERAAAYAEAVRVDAECQAQIDVAVAQEEADLWTWPDGHALVLTKWTWAAGVDAWGTAQHDEGWTAALDYPTHGWFTFMPTKWSDREREVYIGPAVHATAVRYSYTDTASLPDELKETRYLHQPFMYREVWNPAEGRKVILLVPDPDNLIGWHTEIGVEPLPWICSLIDSIEEESAPPRRRFRAKRRET